MYTFPVVPSTMIENSKNVLFHYSAIVLPPFANQMMKSIYPGTFSIKHYESVIYGKVTNFVVS
jgi:hypothetical protein